MTKSSLIFLLIVGSVFTIAQQKPAGKTQQPKPAVKTVEVNSGNIFGEVFSDFNYIVQEPKPFPNTNSTQSGSNSFDLRRAHFGYEQTFSRDFSVRFVYDPAVTAMQEAYLNWENVFSLHSLVIGMMHTPGEKTTEKYFGYRSLGQLVLDRNGYSQEFDRGISLNGKFDPQGSIYYSLTIGNGSGTAVETDKLKKYYFTFGMVPGKGSVAELYLDYENFSAGRSAITAKVLFAMMSPTSSFGAEGFYRLNRKFAGTKDINPAGGSLFAWFELMQSMRGVFRVDVLDYDLNNSGSVITNPSYRELYLNVGLDYSPLAAVHIIPNVAYVKELKKDKGPDIADYILARLTTAVYFN
ncbi:MAG: hypothetical protein WCW35_10110 [Bacteroidota bacterium]